MPFARPSRLLRGLAVVALVAASSSALAQPSSAPLAGDRAVTLADEGQKLYEAGKWDEAFEKFRAANAIVDSPMFRLYMARSRRAQGKLLEARALYRELSAMKAEGAPLAWAQAVSDGKAELAALEPTVPSARVTLEGAPAGALALTLDGAKVAADTAVELDPGQHFAVASVAGREVTQRFELKAGQRDERVVVSFAPTPGPKVPSSEAPATAAEAEGGALGVVGWVLAGVGGASVVVGAITGGLALSEDASWTELCPGGTCPPERRGEIDDARSSSQSLADVSTITLIAGGVLAAAGVTLVIVDATSDAAPAKVEASLSPGWIGVRARF